MRSITIADAPVYVLGNYYNMDDRVVLDQLSIKTMMLTSASITDASTTN
jgi:hypothetical protein